MLIYGAVLEICGRGVSCQMQWKAFAIQQSRLNCGAIFMLSRVIEFRKKSQIVNEMKRQKSRQAGWLFWRLYAGYRKIRYILKWIVLSWGKAGLIQMTWGNSVTSFVSMASFKSEVHVWGQRTHLPAHSTHLILITSFFPNDFWVHRHPPTLYCTP